jgi:Spy/CpxP family protein refolding chaperone
MSETSVGTSVRRKAGLWVAAVFVLGAALGGALGYGFGHHAVSAAITPQSEQERRARRVEQMTKDLTLSSDQRQQLDGILSGLHSEFKALHEQNDAQIDQARQRGRNKIREILTADQKPKFEEFIKKMDEERRRNPQPPPR